MRRTGPALGAALCLLSCPWPAQAQAQAGAGQGDLDIDAILAEGEGEGDEGEGDEGEGDALGESDEDDLLELPLLGATTFSLTSTSLAEYRRNDLAKVPLFDELGSRYAFALTERLELAAQGEEARLSVRLDGFAPLSEPDCGARPTDTLCTLSYDGRPERVSLHWERGDLSLEVGDSHAVFGRGIALTMRKEDILGTDTALRGVYAQYDAERVFVRLLGGLANPQNLDPLTLQIRPDPTDVILGAEAGMRFGDAQDLEVGLHGVRALFERDEMTGRDVDATVVGWHAAAPALADGRVVLYGEANAMLREDEGAASTTGAPRRWYGRAVYASAQLALERWTVTLEWKDYRDFLLAPTNGELPSRIYSGVPALDRDTERFRGVQNSRGGRLEVSHAFLPGPWSVTAVGILYGHGDEERTQDPWDGVLVAHGYAQLTRRNEAGAGGGGEASGEDDDGQASAPVGWSLDVVGGYRQETYLHDPFGDDVGTGDLDWRVVHGEIDGTVSVGDHAFELRVEHRMERIRRFHMVDYERGGVTLTYALGGTLTVSPTLRWDTEKKDSLPALYPGLEAKWELLEGSHVRVFAGRTPGGVLCSGGVCRDVPPFEGFLGELVLRL